MIADIVVYDQSIVPVIPNYEFCIYNYQSTLSLPQKKSATVPGPVWLPMVVPT